MPLTVHWRAGTGTGTSVQTTFVPACWFQQQLSWQLAPLKNIIDTHCPALLPCQLGFAVCPDQYPWVTHAIVGVKAIAV